MSDLKARALRFALLGLSLALSTSALSQTPPQAEPTSPYVGTWRFVSGTYNGQEFDAPALGVTLKHVTPTQFTWLSYEAETGRISRAGGGTYTLAGDSCKEHIEYGTGEDFEMLRGTEQSLEIKVDEDRLYSGGKLSNGTVFSEVWERVK